MIALEDLKIYGVGPDSSTQKSLERAEQYWIHIV